MDSRRTEACADSGYSVSDGVSETVEPDKLEVCVDSGYSTGGSVSDNSVSETDEPDKRVFECTSRTMSDVHINVEFCDKSTQCEFQVKIDNSAITCVENDVQCKVSIDMNVTVDEVECGRVHTESVGVSNLVNEVPHGGGLWEALPQRVIRRRTRREAKSDKLAVVCRTDDAWLVDDKFWLDLPTSKDCDLVRDENKGVPCDTVCDTKLFFDANHASSCQMCASTAFKRPFVSETLELGEEVYRSGLPNYLGCKIPVESNLKIEAWKCRLEGFQDVDVIKFIEFGWPIGLEGQVSHTQCDTNHKGAREYPLEVVSYLVEEVKAGHVLGPFEVPPCGSKTVISPLNTVSKKDSVERRIILDLSFPPGKSINDSIPKDTYLGEGFKLHLPTVDNLVSLIKDKGVGCFMFKRDLKKAYRQIPIDPGDVYALAYRIDDHIFCDRVLPMGLRSSCQACQRVTDGVRYALSIGGCHIVNYIDDLAGAEVEDRVEEADIALRDMLLELGLDEAANKALSPDTCMTFLGIQFDSVALTLTVPADKLKEILSLLDDWIGRTTATKKQVQSLVGSLNFLAACVRPGRLFLSRILNFLREMASQGPVALTPEFRQDLFWWQLFAPLYNGVSIMPIADWSVPDGVVSCDACLSGCGGWFEGLYFHTVFPQFILDMELHINELELLTLVVVCKLWGSQWKGMRIKIFCDNNTSVIVLNTGRTRDKFLQACLREICLLAANNEFEIRTVHLPGVENRIPDILSRWHLNVACHNDFAERTAGLDVQECDVAHDLFKFMHDW